MDADNWLQHMNTQHFTPSRMMAGHGDGSIVFYLTFAGRVAGLEITKYWREKHGMEYTPQLPPGHEFDFA